MPARDVKADLEQALRDWGTPLIPPPGEELTERAAVGWRVRSILAQDTDLARMKAVDVIRTDSRPGVPRQTAISTWILDDEVTRLRGEDREGSLTAGPVLAFGDALLTVLRDDDWVDDRAGRDFAASAVGAFRALAFEVRSNHDVLAGKLPNMWAGWFLGELAAELPTAVSDLPGLFAPDADDPVRAAVRNLLHPPDPGPSASIPQDVNAESGPSKWESFALEGMVRLRLDDATTRIQRRTLSAEALTRQRVLLAGVVRAAEANHRAFEAEETQVVRREIDHGTAHLRIAEVVGGLFASRPALTSAPTTDTVRDLESAAVAFRRWWWAAPQHARSHLGKARKQLNLGMAEEEGSVRRHRASQRAAEAVRIKKDARAVVASRAALGWEVDAKLVNATELELACLPDLGDAEGALSRADVERLLPDSTTDARIDPQRALRIQGLMKIVAAANAPRDSVPRQRIVDAFRQALGMEADPAPRPDLKGLYPAEGMSLKGRQAVDEAAAVNPGTPGRGPGRLRVVRSDRDGQPRNDVGREPGPPKM